MALVNRYVLLEYDVGGPRLWHERLALEHVRNDLYVVVTPDRDIYVEELGLMNNDLRSIRVRAAQGVVPPGVAAEQIYGLPAFGPNEVAGFREEARRVAVAERAGAPGRELPPVDTAEVGASADTAAPYPAGTLKWLFAERAHGKKYGQEVAGFGAALVRGDKQVFDTGGGRLIFVECVDGGELSAFWEKPSACDKRILGLKLNPLGQPERSLQDVARDCVEEPVQWSLTGPRTSKWCVSYLSIEGLGFEGHHERVRQITKADASSWGIQEHFQISMTLRQALCVDQLDATTF